MAAAGCGKKGPPLAPIVHVPAAVDKLAAQRIGNDIYVSVTIPKQNIDASMPADVSRIEILALTSTSTPPPPRMLALATRVGAIEVQPPPRPGEAGAAAPASPSGEAPLPAQGSTVVVRDSLSPADMVPAESPGAPAAAGRASVADTGTAGTSVVHRYYMAVAQSDRGREGPPGAIADVPLLPLPEPPGAPRLTYTQDDVTVSWDPSGGIIGFLFERPLPSEPAPTAEFAAPESASSVGSPTTYNVYRELGAVPDQVAAPPPRSAVLPVPINPMPVAGLTYTDAAALQFGRQRCYTVRAVRGTAADLVISAPSPRACVTPEDVFPPEPPTGLSAIAAGGVISLLWEPNGEADLAGYVVLRGRAGDATLQRLTDAPVMMTSYADRDVTPGVRYVYAVQAVDTHGPAPNVSAESERVEETAR